MDLAKAIDLTASIMARIKQVKDIIGEDEYEREVQRTRPYINALMEQSGTTNPLSAVIDFIGVDGTLSHLAASVLICSAAEMCGEK